MKDLRIFQDAAAAATACAGQMLQWLGEALAERGRATLAISGGSSPRWMFEMFARTEFAWDRVDLFWVDERCVPPEDAQSNYKMANDVWLRPAGFPLANIHRVKGELPPPEAAALYVEDLRLCFALPADQLPRFDVMHRGMGPDAHTASLFPGEPAIGNSTDIAAAVWVEKFQQWRVTLLPGVLSYARHTALLVTGADKTGALQAVLQGPYDPQNYPAQIASGQGSVWFVDAAAAHETQP